MYISGEFGRQWLGTSDSFYGTAVTNPGFAGPFPNGINYADYNTWNIGVGFTYKVFTLDIRYSDTDLSKGDCNAFTSDFAARGNITAGSGTSITAINPTGVASNWCGAGAAERSAASFRLRPPDQAGRVAEGGRFDPPLARSRYRLQLPPAPVVMA